MTDFDHATDADRENAKMAAQREGWSQKGWCYVHPTRGSYLVKDMDGWIDLCDNEAIEWEFRIVTCSACGGDRGHFEGGRWFKCTACNGEGELEIEPEAVTLEDLEA